eukprot:TRINITY_DN32930_c0_g1_i1.p1 TRINITY_DN32930_c0_g1~~TRINITY_DN32930_c0_g1_i1.p1  ORF type:complete len:100 (-),score=1.58 TRINITY_DN32930_c0_g1_i1:24-323(-)
MYSPPPFTGCRFEPGMAANYSKRTGMLDEHATSSRGENGWVGWNTQHNLITVNRLTVLLPSPHRKKKKGGNTGLLTDVSFYLHKVPLLPLPFGFEQSFK